MDHRAIALLSASCLVLLPNALLPADLPGQNPAEAAAPAPPLSIGDPAPALHVGTWVAGEPVAALQRGTIYVLDFWATWCGPCVASMPHTAELQRTYADRGVVVLALTGLDRWGNTEAAVRELVAKQGERIAFRVGIDEPGTGDAYLGVFAGRTTKDWLGKAQVPAIPAVFVVDRDGRIAFVGAPAELDEVLARCVAGTWDLAAAKAQHAARAVAQQLLAELGKAVEAGDDERSVALCKRLVDEITHREARVFAAVADLMARDPAKLAKQAPELALRAARAGVEASKHREPGALGALAKVQFVTGDAPGAVRTITAAMELVEGGMRDAMAKDLAIYRAALTPPR